MPQTQWARLTNEHTIHIVGLDVVNELQQLAFVAPLQLVLQLESGIKMVANRPLVAPCHKDHFPNASRIGFLHRILDQWLVHDRQHLLGNGFGGREKSCSQSTDRKHRFAD